MSEHYHDENDLKLLKEMAQLAPEDFQGVGKPRSDYRARGRKNPAEVSGAHRNLLSPHTTQCVYCIEIHTQNAKRAGASEEVARSGASRRRTSRRRRRCPWDARDEVLR